MQARTNVVPTIVTMIEEWDWYIHSSLLLWYCTVPHWQISNSDQYQTRYLWLFHTRGQKIVLEKYSIRFTCRVFVLSTELHVKGITDCITVFFLLACVMNRCSIADINTVHCHSLAVAVGFAVTFIWNTVTLNIRKVLEMKSLCHTVQCNAFRYLAYKNHFFLCIYKWVWLYSCCVCILTLHKGMLPTMKYVPVVALSYPTVIKADWICTHWQTEWRIARRKEYVTFICKLYFASYYCQRCSETFHVRYLSEIFQKVLR